MIPTEGARHTSARQGEKGGRWGAVRSVRESDVLAVSFRPWVPYAISLVALLPAIWLLSRPFRAPKDPVPTGRVRGSEANLWGPRPNSVVRFSLLVNGSADRRVTRRGSLRVVSKNRETVSYHLTNRDDVCLQLVNEACIDPDERSLALLSRFGGTMSSARRDLANVQEFYLPAVPRPFSWSLTGRSMGGVTTGTTQWRVLTPSLQCSTRAADGSLHSYLPAHPISAASSASEESTPLWKAQELAEHQVELVVYLGDDDRVDAVSAALHYDRGFAKALRIDGRSIPSVDVTVTDLSLVAARERLLFISGIGFGLAASILSTLLVEWSKQ